MILQNEEISVNDSKGKVPRASCSFPDQFVRYYIGLQRMERATGISSAALVRFAIIQLVQASERGELIDFSSLNKAD